MSIENNDAWVLSPYCFCTDRPWLVVNDLEGDIKDGRDLSPIPGMSEEDFALLVALLTALGIFLFLLLLLLCLFCPCGFCCRKTGRCCAKDRKTKTSQSGLKVPYGGRNVNMTAMDLKIPRAWTDDYTGFSDSELDKRKQFWADKDNVRWFGEKYRYDNKAFQEDDVNDDGWSSSYHKSNSYGKVFSSYAGLVGLAGLGGRNKSQKEMFTLDEYYGGSTKNKAISSPVQDKSGSHDNNIEKLMTPYTETNFSTHCNNTVASSYGNNTATNIYGNNMTAGEVAKCDNAYAGRHENVKENQATSVMRNHELMKSKHVSDATFDGVRDTTKSVADSVSYKDNNGQTENIRAVSVVDADRRVAISQAQNYGSNHITTSMTKTDNGGDLMMATDIVRESSVPNYNMIMETTTYMKRIVQETETTSTS